MERTITFIAEDKKREHMIAEKDHAEPLVVHPHQLQENNEHDHEEASI